MLFLLVLVWLYFYSFCLAAEMHMDDDDLDVLFRVCFDMHYQRRPEGIHPQGLFTVHGIDGNREVTLTFKVETGASGLACTLEWVQDDVHPENSKGSIRTVRISDNAAVDPIYDDSSQFPTEIRMTLLNVISSDESEFDFIIIRSLHPNGLVSGKFIKDFLIFLEERYRHNNEIGMLAVIQQDFSNIRELYWLWKGEGRTYFEQEWNLEYDCLTTLPDEERVEFLQLSAGALDFPAMIALNQNEFPHFTGYSPVPQPTNEDSEPTTFTFNQKFVGSLELYRMTKPEGAFQTMTIRDVLQEFIPTWTVGSDGVFTQEEITMMARNTFVYFFRNHPNFTSIAKQVLYGYDQDCDSMTGLLPETIPRDFDFTYQGIDPQAPVVGPGEAGPSNAGAGPSNADDETDVLEREAVESMQQRELRYGLDSGELQMPQRDPSEMTMHAPSEDGEEHVALSLGGRNRSSITLFTFLFFYITYLFRDNFHYCRKQEDIFLHDFTISKL